MVRTTVWAWSARVSKVAPVWLGAFGSRPLSPGRGPCQTAQRGQSACRGAGLVYGATQAVNVEVDQHCWRTRPQAIARSRAHMSRYVQRCDRSADPGKVRVANAALIRQDLSPGSALGGTPV